MSILQPEPCVPDMVPGLDQAVMISASGVGTTDATGSPPANVPLTPEAPVVNDYIAVTGDDIEFLQAGVYEIQGAAGAGVTAAVLLDSEAGGASFLLISVEEYPGQAPGSFPFYGALNRNGPSSMDQTFQVGQMVTTGTSTPRSQLVVDANDTIQLVLVGDSSLTFIGDAAGPGDPVADAEITAYVNLWIRYVGPLPEAP